MYDNLKTINLTEYLNKCCGGPNWIKDSWLVSLDYFVGTLSDENKTIIKSKFKNNQELPRQNDMLNEIMIACAFHPTASFIEEKENEKTYDLFDNSLNLKIEVKSLNEGDDEKERHKQDSFSDWLIHLSDSELQNEKIKITANISKKCNDHFSKAVHQLDNCGKIYLIYDYNLLSRENIGTDKEPTFAKTHHSVLLKKDIEKAIQNYLNDFSKCHSKIFAEAIYFGDLREKVANFKISDLQ